MGSMRSVTAATPSASARPAARSTIGLDRSPGTEENRFARRPQQAAQGSLDLLPQPRPRDEPGLCCPLQADRAVVEPSPAELSASTGTSCPMGTRPGTGARRLLNLPVGAQDEHLQHRVSPPSGTPETGIGSKRWGKG